MKKILSLMLALVLISGVFVPVVNAEGDIGDDIQSDYVFRKIKEIYGKVESVEESELVIKGLVKKLINQEFINEVYDVIGSVLNDTKHADLKTHLKKNIKISRDNPGEGEINAEEIKNVIVWWINEDSINGLIENLKVESMSVESKEYLNEIITAIGDEIPGDWEIGVLESGAKKDIVNIVFALFNETIGALEVEEDQAGNFIFTVRSSAKIEDKINGFLIEDAKFSTQLSSAIRDVVKKLEGSFNDKKPVGMNSKIGSFLKALGAEYEPYVEPTTPDPDPDPSTPPTPPSGGGGGGGGGGAPGPAPQITPSIIIDIPTATATVGKDSITTSKDPKATRIGVKEAETLKAVKDLRDDLGKTKAATMVLDADTVKGLNITTELSTKLVQALVKNKVDIQIKTADSEILIPVKALAGITMEANSKLELRIKEAPNSEANDLVAETKDVKKVLDLNLVLVKGNEETIITSFKTYITVKLNVRGLGDPDKLAVYYLNEEENALEFVTGKIKDSMAILELKHFSKYVILESKASFSDVKDHWSKIYVESMVAKNIIAGYPDETFRPNGNITRAEFAKMIVHALELDIVKYTGKFADVNTEDWHSDYISTLVQSGLAGGYGDGTFRPNNKITRAEMATILSNGLDVVVETSEVTSIINKFNDSDSIQDWSKQAIALLVKENIMVGSNNKFNPADTTTRAEAATAIYRLYNK